ncbi:unnamed protein product [Bemisia tabaci]|uniref:Uncharacterized protein n=1 Tax=Bemisia tabaci TaxID=7038 RepID=A0A9P0AEK5_BEMTA|nr:unnamed protein product [Bemisia tabaci]
MAGRGRHNFMDTSNDSNNNSPIPEKKSRLEVERSHLEVERSRLEVEMSRLEVEKKKSGFNNSPIPEKKSRLEVEKSRLEVEKKESGLPCFCNRKPNGIYCNNCQTFTPNVRIRRACPQHPQVLWLMDLESCPNCLKDHNLMELSR